MPLLSFACRAGADYGRRPRRGGSVPALLLLLPSVFAPPQAPAAPAPAPAPAAADATPIVVDDEAAAVIDGALRYLASKQLPSGTWSADEQPVAITSFVLLAFLASGHVPDEGPYGRPVAAGVQFLVDSLQPDGLFHPSTQSQYMYGHGIATVVLAEAYGQSRSPRLREKLGKAVDVIVRGQNALGGWRYQPGDRFADISVTVLQVVALRAAQGAGLAVPKQTIDRAVEFVRKCYDKDSGGFTYMANQRGGTFARTAAALYSLQVCGRYDDPLTAPAVKFLQARRAEKDWYTYGHLYAAAALSMVGGEAWSDWYPHIRGVLVGAAVREGDLVHWETTLDREAHQSVSRIWCTAVYAAILAVPHHYVPLWQR